MSRKRGRQARQYRVRVRTLRRDPIDYDALARAALEHAAMHEQSDTQATPPDQRQLQRKRASNGNKEPRHDRLA